MKNILIGISFIAIFLLNTAPVFAHLAGQPPYFKINGIYTGLYPVPLTSLSDFNLPQDSAPENYLVDQQLDFEIDTSQLPAPPDILEDTTFLWDFGDGTKAEGLKNTHIYTKPGSYIFRMDAKYGQSDPQFLQSVLINITENTNYKLPTVKISANGQIPEDPLLDILNLDFNEPISLKAVISDPDIVEFTWDFGDGKKSSGQNVQYQYSEDLSQVFPVIRIKTKDGFIADNYIQINNKTVAPPNFNPITKINNFAGQYKYFLMAFVILILLVTSYMIIKKHRKKDEIPPIQT